MFSLIVAVLTNNRLAWALSTFASFITMIFSILLCFEISNSSNISYYLGNWPPPLGIEYVIDKISIIPINTNTKKITFSIEFNLRDSGDLVFEEKLLNNQTKTTKINNIIKILNIY